MLPAALRTRWSLALLLLIVGNAAIPRETWAQRFVLELRPRFGDTLRLRLDQTSEVSGSRQGRASTKQIVTTLSMFSRAIVEHSTPASATILAITDSVTFNSTDDRAMPLMRATQSQLTGRQMRLRLAPDGTVTLADDVPRVAREVAELVSVMPASFPRASVAIGDTWLREVPIPPAASYGVPLGGVVKAAFRLDSVSADGHNAYLTLRGTVVQPGSTPADKGMITGSLNGNMIVDRHRGWLSESRFLVQMRTTVTPTGAAPMDFRVKVTQHMRVIER
jgi:hypothetical protein